MALIECTNIWKWYPSPEGKLEVIKGINFTLQPAEFVAIVGASGVGKSTFLNILGLIDMPSDGKIALDGKEVSNLNSAATANIRAKTVGFVFQFHHLLPEFTALENLLVPTMIAGTNINVAKKNAGNLLDLLGLTERMNHYPSQLSGGEQQRVALARSLMNSPRIIVADEPTGNLDSENSLKFMELAQQIRLESGIAMVLATHNPQIASFADRTLRLTKGNLDVEVLKPL
jgi:lipoprotein-releasing system ATP-binding protein